MPSQGGLLNYFWKNKKNKLKILVRLDRFYLSSIFLYKYQIYDYYIREDSVLSYYLITKFILQL